MARVVARAVRTRERPLPRDLSIPYGAATLHLSVAESERIVGLARRRPGTHNARRRFVEQQVLQLLAQEYDLTRRRMGASPEPAGAGLAPHDGPVAAEVAGLVEVGRQIRRVPAVAEALDRMWPRLSPHELVHDLFGARALLAAAGRGILAPRELGLLYRPRSRSLDEVLWTAADAALVDEARAHLGPRRARPRQRAVSRDRADRLREEVGYWPAGLGTTPLPGGSADPGRTADTGEDEVRSYGHIVVDEAQDLSPMQLRMLARRSISGSMTVVGDIAQATGPWTPSGWQEVAAHLTPSRPPRLVELTVGYRTPAEVMAVAAGVLAAAAPGLRPPRPVRRSGSEPGVLRAEPGALASAVGDAAAAALAVTERSGGRAAVLVPGALFGEIVRALAERGLDPVDPRDPDGPGLAAALVVLPADESHGLEFDAVVVAEPAAIAAGDGRGGEHPRTPTTQGLRTLYVALTRPTQRLDVVHSVGLPEAMRAG
jgi:hypothetical protein